MINLPESFLEVLKILVLGSVFFVWVVRYDNIVSEFKEYGYPNWLRDLVGILKLSFAVMLQHSSESIVLVGALGLSGLMVGAVVTHLRVNNPLKKILPSLGLFSLSMLVAVTI